MELFLGLEVSLVDLLHLFSFLLEHIVQRVHNFVFLLIEHVQGLLL